MLKSAGLSLAALVLFSNGVGHTAFAQQIEFIQEKSGALMDGTDDAMNYYANEKQLEQQRRLQLEKQGLEKGIPASELETLPAEVSLEGKASVKVEGGKIVASTNNGSTQYIDCEELAKNPFLKAHDGCKQKFGQEPEAAVPAKPVVQNYDPAPRAPTTLDAQLENKIGVKNAAPDNSPFSPSVPNSADVEKNAVVDKERGAKTNIISNTDTGVKLGH